MLPWVLSGWKLGDRCPGFSVPGSCWVCPFRATFRDPAPKRPSPRRGLQAPAGDGSSRGPRGPQSPRPCNGAAPGCRVAPHCPSVRPPGVRLPRLREGCSGEAVRAGPGRGSASHGPRPLSRVSPEAGKMASGAGPRGDPGRPESPRTCGGSGSAFVRNRNCAPSRARPPPRTCPRPAQVRPAGMSGLALQTGAARARWALQWPRAFRAVTGRGPAASPARGQSDPGELRAPHALAASPGLLGAKPLGKPLIVTVMFAGLSRPGGRDAAVAAATFSPSTRAGPALGRLFSPKLRSGSPGRARYRRCPSRGRRRAGR